MHIFKRYAYNNSHKIRVRDTDREESAMTCTITTEQIHAFENALRLEERCEATIQKYVNAVTRFYDFLADGKEVTKERLIEWKSSVTGSLTADTVNVMISAVNAFFKFLSRPDMKIRQIKIQRKIYRDQTRELTEKEYRRLLDTAQKNGNRRLYCLMQTLASTGIRISELKYITVESLKIGSATVDCKGKQRVILLPKQLRKILRDYCDSKKITGGAVFVTRSGRPMHRSNIWKALRGLCDAAHVNPRKVFPHNFRHLFAVTFYRAEKDIAKLADLLGHASVNTTRIYIMESGAEHERRIEKLGLVV